MTPAEDWAEYVASPSTVGAMERFVSAVPEVEPLWREHLHDNGEALPHVFFGDVSRFAVEMAERGDVDLTERFSRAIEELAASDDPDVVNVIQVSFAENLMWGDEHEEDALVKLRRSFGPMTLQRFDEYEAHMAELAEAVAKLEESERDVSDESDDGDASGDRLTSHL